jgi:hypothetical protein
MALRASGMLILLDLLDIASVSFVVLKTLLRVSTISLPDAAEIFRAIFVGSTIKNRLRDTERTLLIFYFSKASNALSANIQPLSSPGYAALVKLGQKSAHGLHTLIFLIFLYVDLFFAMCTSLSFFE